MRQDPKSDFQVLVISARSWLARLGLLVFARGFLCPQRSCWLGPGLANSMHVRRVPFHDPSKYLDPISRAGGPNFLSIISCSLFEDGERIPFLEVKKE